MINLIRQYLFWKKYKNRLHEFKEGMSPELYAIAPNSFKITRQNWKKLGGAE